MTQKAYEKWKKKFLNSLGKEMEKDIVKEVDDNILHGFKKSELKWPPLSPARAAWKKKNGKSLEGLKNHGNMAKATDTQIKISGNTIHIKVQNNQNYSGIHEEGLGNAPKRAFIKPAVQKCLKNTGRIAARAAKNIK
ncbi:hypothetical protein [Methanococcus maripaludis]|uniref:Uncharacterized protein n=1 Tax=Methanococcus maripaludis TaxID=39152 RepID=A0A7J9S0R0_METMI|nr:hypothetical protein [Methanococcus maripaludis]MBB6067879.1 hypothetical protein [Methanococcus maripaludis]